jgi:transposase
MDAYNGLVDLGYKKHYRLDHSRNEFVKGKSHINGIEGFWGFAKSRLAKFKGMNRKTFYLHLKECEFRFNFRNENIYKMLIKNLVIEPLN